MEISEGVTLVEGVVWKLLKCMYGLKQSPHGHDWWLNVNVAIRDCEGDCSIR